MSRSLGPALTPALCARLSQADLRARLGRAVPLITVDAAGLPHPMLCSYLELLAVDARTIRVAIAGASGSARNLAERGTATLVLVEPGLAVYVKCRAAGPPLALGALARFELMVEDVLEDVATGWEEGVGITSGIAYAPVPDLDAPEVKALLAALRETSGRSPTV
jgi:hypothetical protein